MSDRKLSDERYRRDQAVYRGLDLRLARLARFFIRHKLAGLLLQVAIAGACIWALAGMRLRDDPNAWPPRSDSYVQLNDRIAQQFGGANSVSIEMAVEHGTIYSVPNLTTLKGITDDLYLVTGVIPYAIRSLATLDSERYDFLNKGTKDATMVIAPIMPQSPADEGEAKDIQKWTRDNPLLDGVLVSKDGKAALILADFRSLRPPHAHVEVAVTEPVEIYHAINAILKKYQRPGITLRAAGTPIVIGWVNSTGLRYVAIAFGIFMLTIALILWYGFRTLSGVLLPLRVALLGTLMGFGLYRLCFGVTLYSAAALLAPFIVVAAGACHSVQFLTRFFFEEYPRLHDVEDAIVSTFVSRLRPMLVSLLCDVIPFAVMAMIPFENVRALGIVTCLGLLSLTVDEFLMMIPALSSITLKELTASRARVLGAAKSSGPLDAALARGVRRLIADRALGIWVVLGALAVSAVFGWIVTGARIGQDNTYAVHNYLTHSWNHSEIYREEREIVARFGGVYPMTVLIKGKSGINKALEQPAVMRAVDELASFLRSQPKVGSVADVAFPIKLRSEFVHEVDARYFKVPDAQELGESLVGMENQEPGLYDWLFSYDYNSTVVTAYVASTDPQAVSNLMNATRAKTRELFAGLPVEVEVAGGSVGIAQAFNRNIRYWLIVGAALGVLGTVLLAIPSIGSATLAMLLIVPLVLGSIIALGLMVLAGVELNSNAVAALAIASGVGIDSEVYLLYRVREEYQRLGDFREALVQGYVKIRRALIVSNGALIFGCGILTPVPLYIGYVGFGMALVLALCFLMSAILSPILWSWFGRKVVAGVSPVAADAGGRSEPRMATL